jgi:hypothetical protein
VCTQEVVRDKNVHQSDAHQEFVGEFAQSEEEEVVRDKNVRGMDDHQGPGGGGAGAAAAAAVVEEGGMVGGDMTRLSVAKSLLPVFFFGGMVVGT